MKPQYEPKNFGQCIGYLVEEIGEVLEALCSPRRWPETTAEAHARELIPCCGRALAAAGKTIRWGRRSHNPELPETERETNADWLLRELVALESALRSSHGLGGDEVRDLDIEIDDAIGAIDRLRPLLLPSNIERFDAGLTSHFGERR